MTRKEIESQYQTRDGRIVSPGKFEGEAVYAPYFYDAMLNGGGTDMEDGILSFDIEASDVAEFPELADVSQVLLQEDDQGFVWLALLPSNPERN